METEHSVALFPLKLAETGGFHVRQNIRLVPKLIKLSCWFPRKRAARFL